MAQNDGLSYAPGLQPVQGATDARDREERELWTKKTSGSEVLRLWTSDFDIIDVLENHSDFVEMREPYSKVPSNSKV